MIISKKSQPKLLEQYRIALENVKEQSEIAIKMADLSYDAIKIAEGKELLIQTRNGYDFNKKENEKTVAASTLFKQEKKHLDKQFKEHRKKSKAILRKNPEILQKLGIDTVVPNAYINWIEMIRRFYTNIDKDILQKLKPLKITAEDIHASKLQIEKVEKARAVYIQKVGESQDATKQKNIIFAKMEDWMRDFYNIAVIALKDSPQLLEAIGRKRKS
ncbi:hypothetical protein [Aquimarina longa]|uniref:hypothetical protein n=1 Tax=Aquimarina longa TaxID=1080221 RepID=UPI0007863B16|nr:hypothetical protein [Aquimarina longa]